MKKNKKEFHESLVIVTGGSRGIGKAICYEFAAKGANIIFIYKNRHNEAKKTFTHLKSLDVSVEKICGDVSNFNAMQKIFSKIFESHGKVDVLVNNAGIIKDKILNKQSIKDWDEVIQTNLTGCFTCSKAVIENMKSQNYGRIINISSIIALTGNYGQTNYAASKAGIIGFTKSLALETARYDITINAVCPGFTKTEMLTTIPPEIKQKILNKIPKKRFAFPEEIARVVVFLASPRSGYITGQILNVNGGLYM